MSVVKYSKYVGKGFHPSSNFITFWGFPLPTKEKGSIREKARLFTLFEHLCSREKKILDVFPLSLYK